MKRTEISNTPLRLCRLTSLRNRYLAATVILATLLTACALLLQHYITSVRSERTSSIESREQTASHSRALRDAVLEVERSLTVYFWAPSTERRQAVFHAVDAAHAQQRLLQALPYPQAADLAPLTLELQGLHSRLDQLMENPPQGAQLPPTGIFAPLWQQLQQLDQRLEESAATEVSYLHQASRNVIGSIWLLAVGALVLMLLGFFLFQRYVLGPISLVARALRDEAHGKRDLLLPLPATEETQHLVEAFKEMRRQVMDRQQALEHQAMHDALTGLPNRVLLQDRDRKSVV